MKRSDLLALVLDGQTRRSLEAFAGSFEGPAKDE